MFLQFYVHNISYVQFESTNFRNTNRSKPQETGKSFLWIKEKVLLMSLERNIVAKDEETFPLVKIFSL